MTDSRIHHIAIIGGGFSGTMTAVNLARLSDCPLRVTLVNSGYPAGRGIAYGTRRPEHLLNVAARNMSALPDHPNHFVEWLRTRTEYATVADAELRETFVPRCLYGDYLRSLILHCTRSIDRRTRAEIELLEAEAVDLGPEGDGVQVFLSDGRSFAAHKALLATGNEPPAAIPGCDAVATHPGWCANPWVGWENRLPPPGENIVLLGTGLTAVDAIITLLALDWRGTVFAVSRNGLLPQSHFKGVDDPDFPPAHVDFAELGLKGLARLIGEHCERLRRLGANPAMVVDKLRPHTQRVWQAFSDTERREFVAQHAARWNVIRHRIAPTIHRQVAAAVEQRRLQVTRAGVVGVHARGSRIGIELRGGDGAISHLEAALAINCTGPHTRFSATGSRLLQNLLRRGLAQPDAMDMGVRVGPDFAVVHGNGHRSRFLFAIGPLLRGTLWESVAVPELRGQALRVAQTLLDEMPLAAAKAGRWPAPEEEAVIEFSI
jgi:uncharacterized NAD(P)/FAD-binding protein YdhS